MDYLRLGELAASQGVTIDALIRLGAEEALPIYVVPSPQWRMAATAVKQFQDADGDPGCHYLNGEITGALLAQLKLQVPPALLQIFRNYPDAATVDAFYYVVEGGKIDGALLRPIGDAPLYLKDCCLVVKNGDVSKLNLVKAERILPRKKTRAEKRSSEALSAIPPLVEAAARKGHLEKSPRLAQSELLRIDDVSNMVGLSEGSIRNYMNAGNFPKSISLGPRTVAWKRVEVEAWIEQRAGK